MFFSMFFSILSADGLFTAFQGAETAVLPTYGARQNEKEGGGGDDARAKPGGKKLLYCTARASSFSALP